jgi:hypothetical protein
MKVVLQISKLEIRFNLQATSFDLDDVLTFTIIDGSMSVTDSSLNYLVDKKPFKINNYTLLLNFDFQDSSLKGTFKFKIQTKNLGQFFYSTGHL